MTDHLTDAAVSPERLDELYSLLDEELTVMHTHEGQSPKWAALEELEIQNALRELKALRARWSNFEAMLTKQAADAKSGAGRSIAESIHEEATILTVLNTMRRLSGSAAPEQPDAEPISLSSHPVDVIKHFVPNLDPEAESKMRAICDERVPVKAALDDDQLQRIGQALQYLFPELPEVPLNIWHRFSFDVVQDAGGVSVSHIRFAPI